MKIELSEADAQKLIDSQRATITRLEGKLKKIGENVTKMIEYEATIPTEFLKAATDLCGRYFGERVNPDFLEEMSQIYQNLLKEKNEYKRPKVKLFSVEFLFAAIGSDPWKMSNVRHHLKEIIEDCGMKVPEWLQSS